MSTCISSHGEFGSHDLDDAFTCKLCHVLDEEAITERFRQLRAERDALWTAASHLVDLTRRNGSSLLVGHAITLLGQLTDHMPEAFPAPNVGLDYARGVTLGRELLAVLAQAGFAVVKVAGTPAGTGAAWLATELADLRAERDALRVGVQALIDDHVPGTVHPIVSPYIANRLRRLLDQTSITGE